MESGVVRTVAPHRAVAALLAVARRRGPLAGDTTVVAIDGPSGSGKSTLADRLVTALTDDGQTASLVRMDDLYPGWDGLESSIPLLVDEVLAPVAAGRPAAFRRYDWEHGGYGGRVPVPQACWLVVEGVGCGSRRCAPYLSALAWVDAPASVRRSRALTRDGGTFRPFWDRWAAQEAIVLPREETARRADVLLDSSDRPGENRGMALEPAPLDGVPADSTVLCEALVEMTRAQGEDVTVAQAEGRITLTRRTPFLTITSLSNGGALLHFHYREAVPDDPRLSHRTGSDDPPSLQVDPSAMDSDLIALEALVEMAYAQNG